MEPLPPITPLHSRNTVITITRPIYKWKGGATCSRGNSHGLPCPGGCHFVPGMLLGTLGGGEGWGGIESSSDWLARKADLHSPDPQTTVSE